MSAFKHPLLFLFGSSGVIVEDELILGVGLRIVLWCGDEHALGYGYERVSESTLSISGLRLSSPEMTDPRTIIKAPRCLITGYCLNRDLPSGQLPRQDTRRTRPSPWPSFHTELWPTKGPPN